MDRLMELHPFGGGRPRLRAGTGRPGRGAPPAGATEA